MKTVFRKDDPTLFFKLWNEYTATFSSTVRYTEKILEYYFSYTTQLIEDLSFIVLQDRNPVGICLFPIEKHLNSKTVSINGGYVPAPLSVDHKTEKFIFSVIHELVNVNHIDAVRFSIDPTLGLPQPQHNFLLDYGFVDSSSSDGIIQLTGNELWNNLRKGHRLSIKEIQADPSYILHVMDYKNADFNLHENYRTLHRLCSGRETRPPASFLKQFEMVQSDMAVMVGIKHEEKFVGFSYFLHYQSTALYFSAADAPAYVDEKRVPVYHSTIWGAIQYYQKRNFKYLELSQPFALSPQFGEHFDGKTKNISTFKRGFAGEILPCFRGVLYLNLELYKSEHAQFLEELTIFTTITTRQNPPQ